ncbi:hypothetical protein [Leptospira brenneri]|uniref:hypothetical protein n=1 Tax=Leptospira brenneri TaxID=2023182 RepID=UPI000C2B334E|nr:hypothetical protein [Leptospira brenneri]PJZ43753.1 hypothetical protein CH361_18545 [Leptospira brenneri]
MIELQKDTKELIFNFLVGNISLLEFEIFLSASKEIESNFQHDDYIELLSLNYNKRENKYEASKLIERNIDLSEYEAWKLNEILNNIIHKGDNYPKSIASLYDLYCKGYNFLAILGLSFGLQLLCPREYNYEKNLAELSKEEQESLANSLYPEIIYHAQLIQDFISNKKLILLGLSDEDNHYEYFDYRNSEERARTEFGKIEAKKRWWQFWK